VPGCAKSAFGTKQGAFRVLYVANVGDAVYVLHAFQKKKQQTAKRHLDLATSRLRQI
jgi:phage-related protein